jgi:desampylase
LGVADGPVKISGIVHLSGAVRADIIAHAREEAPRECCGLLIGSGDVIDGNVRVRNMHSNPARFLIDPAAHIATNRRLRGTARSVVGCYHSHPHSPPIPSATDLAEAYYPDFVWIIVSFSSSRDGEIAAFRITPESVMTMVISSA